MKKSSEYTVELLVESGDIKQEQIDQGWKKVADSEGKLDIIQALVELKFVTEDQVTNMLAQQYGLETINLDEYVVPEDVLNRVSTELAREYRVVPVMYEKRQNSDLLTVAISDPSDIETIDALRFRLKIDVEAVVTTRKSIDKMLDKYYDISGLIDVEKLLKDDKREMICGRHCGLTCKANQPHTERQENNICYEGIPFFGKARTESGKIKPPLGLRPRFVIRIDRTKEVLEAISRYVNEDRAIPQEWLVELSKWNDEKIEEEKNRK